MFYDRYQQLCKACGKSPSRVAIETGISKGTVSTWKNLGRTPQTAQLQKLADYFGISIDQLLDETKSALTAVNREGEEKHRLPLGATPCNAAQVAPLLGTVRAGFPMYAEENIEGYIPIRQDDGASYFWLNVQGDSMNAAGLDEGDQILVREQPEVENGEIAVVLVNGDEATVKAFRQEGDLVILTPRSTNPAHQPQVYDLRRTPVRVLGLVVESRKVFRRC